MVVAVLAPGLWGCSGTPLDDVDQLLLYAGRGDGTFDTGLPVFHRRLEPNPPDPPVVTTGDFDGDGDDDVAWIDPGLAQIEVLLSDGKGGFEWGETAPGTHPNLTALTSADIDGDGRDDLAASSSAGVTLLRSEGTTFAFSDREAFEGMRNADFGDASGDGIPDMFVASAAPEGTRITVIEGRGNGSFHEPAAYDVTGVFRVHAANFDRDTTADALLQEDPVGFSIMANDGTGRLLPPRAYGTLLGATCLHVADIDLDGDDDIIGSPSASVVENLGGLIFDDREAYDPTVLHPCGPLADLDGDTVPDFVRLDDRELRVLLADGEGGLEAPLVQTVDLTEHFDVYTITAGDFDGDGHHDLMLWARAGDGSPDVETGPTAGE